MAIAGDRRWWFAIWPVLAAGVFGCGADATAPPAGSAGSAAGRPTPHIVWLVADRVGHDVERRLAAAGGVTWSAPLDGVPVVRAAAHAVLLTGQAPAVLGLDADGRLRAPPSVDTTFLPLALRRAGYYTSRSGPARHGLAVPRLTAGPVEEAPASPPSILGAWDAAGPGADWRDRTKDWDAPCTVAFGCGGGRGSDPSFFALFTPETAAVDDRVSALVERLVAEALVDDTVVAVVGLDRAQARVAIRWPAGRPAPEAPARAVDLVDLVPTTLAVAGLPVPPTLPGHALVAAAAPASTPPAPAPAGPRGDDGARPTAATPGGYPTGGLFHVAPRVELWCDTPGATIVYTTERDAPFYWRLYRGPFRMRFWELRVRCGRLGYRDSEVVTYEFDIE